MLFDLLNQSYKLVYTVEEQTPQVLINPSTLIYPDNEDMIGSREIFLGLKL